MSVFPLFILKLVKFLAGEMKSSSLAILVMLVCNQYYLKWLGPLRQVSQGKKKVFASELC